MLLYTFSIVLSLQFSLVSLIETCESRKTCKECILDSSTCAWCGSDNFSGTRCRSSGKKDWCPELLVDPDKNVTNFVDLPFNNTSGHVIQIRPQKTKIQLRPGQLVHFNFSFQGASDFPVDLYFLFDASKTMSHRAAATAEQSKNIYNTLKTMTNNVNLGLGAFVDKDTYPYARIGKRESFSFRHYLKLTDKQEEFESQVKNMIQGENIDEQEGGLDALSQVITCKNLIGWRKESRKIIVFLTDGPYHAVGDGRAAGIFKPYDGECHSFNGTYTEELTMDYPSAAIISRLAKKNDIVIIFSIDCITPCTEMQEIYRNLSAVIRGSKCAFMESNHGKIGKDDNIVKVLEEVYEDITRKVKLKVDINNGKRANYDINFTPNCTEDDSELDCDIKIGEEKQFNGTLKLLEYDGIPKTSLDIVLEGIGEKLILDIDVINNCDSCPSENNSEYCHGQLRHCGACICSEYRYGDTCACLKSGHLIGISNCNANGSDITCSGHGSCICGRCSCLDGYQGDYCECNKNSCPLGEDGQICSGPKHGECMCNSETRSSKCRCKDQWEGDACDCYKSDGHCKTKGSNTHCSHRGNCICGRCQCNPIAVWDKRNAQDDRCKLSPGAECHNLQCQVLEECARCIYSGYRPCHFCIVGVNATTQELVPQESSEWKLCKPIWVGVGCYAQFAYSYDDDAYSLDMVVQSRANCAEVHYVIGGISIGAVLLIGLATIIGWKFITDARDRREYEEFSKKHPDVDEVSQNPLYAPPITAVDNPKFRKPSVY